jgi:cell wall-associated NlpC family hydrolase
MRPEEQTKRALGTRLLVAALLLLSGLAGVQQAQARPSQADLESAKAHLNALNGRMDVLVEEYDQAQVALAQTEERLAQARSEVAKAQAQAHAARSDLATRASLAYQGVGSELDTLLGATSFAQFSDRLEFLNQIAGNDASAVARASVTGQRAKWAGQDLAHAVEQRTAVLRGLSAKKAEIQTSVSEAQSLIDRIETALAKPVYVPQAPSAAPSVQLDSHPSYSSPVVNGSVQAVLDAAYSVIGVPYVYAGSTPEGGFDCSGFTMWAWAHAGVSLPHSSAMQYDVLPHVSRSDLQPGDLVFFYSPIHHVGLYVGGGMMIHAPHTGAYVEKVPVYTSEYVGAARP